MELEACGEQRGPSLIIQHNCLPIGGMSEGSCVPVNVVAKVALGHIELA
jgi:hypothetical protein